MYQLSKNQEEWLKNKPNRNILEEFIKTKKGKCALTDVELVFDKQEGTPKKGKGCHALYASVDHIIPNGDNSLENLQLVCYAINDLKGHMPNKLFSVIKNSDEWKEFKDGWQELAKSETSESKDFYKFIKNFDN